MPGFFNASGQRVGFEMIGQLYMQCLAADLGLFLHFSKVCRPQHLESFLFIGVKLIQMDQIVLLKVSIIFHRENDLVK